MKLLKPTLYIALFASLVFNCDEDTSSTKDEYKVTMKKETEQKVGKSELSFKVTKGGEAVTGADLEVEVLMNMGNHNDSGMEMKHTTFQNEVTERGDGVYDVTVRYLMPTMNGTVHLGDWSIQVDGGDFSEEFDVTVTGSMMDRYTLNGATDDTYNNEGAEAARPYVSFLESSGDTIQLFIGYRNMMMNHQALALGNSLKFFDGSSEVVETIVARVSTDTTSWINLDDDGNGIFSTDSLNTAMADKIYLSLIVNGRETANGGNPYVAIPLSM